MTQQTIKPKPIEEVTTKVSINPSLSTEKLATILLSKSELENCWMPKGVIKIKGKKIFSGGKRQWQAILSIADPEYVNSGDIRFENHPYFHWSKAKELISKKFGFISVSYIGTKTKIRGVILGCNEQQENAKRLNNLALQFEKNTSKYKLSDFKCSATIPVACEIPFLKEALNID